MKVADMIPSVRVALLKRAEAVDPLAEIDRWGKVKFSRVGKEYRYNIKSNVIRLEVKVTHAASTYNRETKEWVRVKSYNIKKVYEMLKRYGEINA